jgi:hypothetical protein
MDKVRQQIQKSYDDGIISTEQFIKANIQYSFLLDITADINQLDILEKGGKRAMVGEIRTFGGREYIKTTNGWKFHGKGTGVKAKEHIAGAGGNKPAAPAAKKESPSAPVSKEPTPKPSQPTTPTPKPKKEPASMPAMTKDEIAKVISGYWLGNARDGKMQIDITDKGFDIDIPTDDRGPRQDHGGPSGDGWMGSEEVNNARAPFVKKYKDKMDSIKKDFEKRGYETTVHLDYGEKGHVGLYVSGKFDASKAPKAPKGPGVSVTKFIDGLTKKFGKSYGFEVKSLGKNFNGHGEVYLMRFGQMESIQFAPKATHIVIRSVGGDSSGVLRAAQAHGVGGSTYSGHYVGTASYDFKGKKVNKSTFYDIVNIIKAGRDKSNKAMADYYKNRGNTSGTID